MGIANIDWFSADGLWNHIADSFESSFLAICTKCKSK